MIKMVSSSQGAPPPPIVPKTNKKLKLLDVEPLELARQLTIMESQLYQRIRPMECLQRAREQRNDNNIDNITVVIQTSNKVGTCVVFREPRLSLRRSLSGSRRPSSPRKIHGDEPMW